MIHYMNSPWGIAANIIRTFTGVGSERCLYVINYSPIMQNMPLYCRTKTPLPKLQMLAINILRLVHLAVCRLTSSIQIVFNGRMLTESPVSVSGSRQIDANQSR